MRIIYNGYRYSDFDSIKRGKIPVLTKIKPRSRAYWFTDDPWVSKVISSGKSWSTRSMTRIKSPQNGLCHFLSAKTWASNQTRYKLVTGFYIIEDMWIPHTWLWDLRGKHIVESTANTGVAYFGIALTPAQAKKFALDEGIKIKKSAALIPKSEWKASAESISKKAEENAVLAFEELKKGTKSFRIRYSTRGVSESGDSHHDGSSPFKKKLASLGVKMQSPVPDKTYNLASFVAKYDGKTWWVSVDSGRLAAGYGGAPGMGYPVTYAHTYKFKMK